MTGVASPSLSTDANKNSFTFSLCLYSNRLNQVGQVQQNIGQVNFSPLKLNVWCKSYVKTLVVSNSRVWAEYCLLVDFKWHRKKTLCTAAYVLYSKGLVKLSPVNFCQGRGQQVRKNIKFETRSSLGNKVWGIRYAMSYELWW